MGAKVSDPASLRPVTWLEFVSATLGQLVWPALIVVLVLILKEPIRSLMTSPGLRRVKAGPAGIELEIDRTLEEAKRELDQGQLGPPPKLPTPEEQQLAADFSEEMRQLAEIQPRAVVMESHTRLEHLLRRLVDVPRDHRGQRPGFLNLRALGRLAVEQGLLTENEASALDELAVVRNAVAHSSDQVISFERALEYAELVKQLAISLAVATGEAGLDRSPIL